MSRPTPVTLSPSLDIGVAGKIGLVNARFGVGGQRVCDEVAQGGSHHEDGRVWSEQQVDVGTVGLEGGVGAHDDSKDDCWLRRLLAQGTLE